MMCSFVDDRKTSVEKLYFLLGHDAQAGMMCRFADDRKTSVEKLFFLLVRDAQSCWQGRLANVLYWF